MSNKEFLLKIIDDIKTAKNQTKNWRGTLTSWVKC